MTIFCLTFAPTASTFGAGDSSPSQYLLGCTSTGKICFWYLAAAGCESGNGRGHQAPLAILEATNVQQQGVLYHISFIEREGAQQHSLVASGRGGAVLYRWPDICARLDRIVAETSSRCSTLSSSSSSSATLLHDVQPISTLPIHPTPNPRALGRIYSTSFDATHGVLYGAADDGYGTYAWDIERGQVLGTLGRRSSRSTKCSIGSSSDSLQHFVVHGDGKGKVITGGNGGALELWDARQLSLIESIDCSSCLCEGAAANNVVSADHDRAISCNIASLSISSLDMTGSGDWAAIGGQCTHAYPSAVRKNTENGGGFVSLFHLPSRTLSSAYMTRESIQDVKYIDSFQKIVTVGNEGVISYWDSSNLTTDRTCRAWLSTPNAHCVAVDNEESPLQGNDYLVAVGGTGSMVDCFSNQNKAFESSFAC